MNNKSVARVGLVISAVGVGVLLYNMYNPYMSKESATTVFVTSAIFGIASGYVLYVKK